MKNTILQIKDLSKSYANQGMQNHVLKHIDLDVYEGDFTVIMGPSGSGKSTLLYCIGAMEKVSGGEVVYRNKNIVAMKEKELAQLRRKDYGFVFQQIHLVNTLSLLENICVSGYLAKDFGEKEVRARAEELLRKVGLQEAKDRLPSQVSGGEAQRAAIARALINRPSLLFADEPTGALNRANSDQVLDLFSEIHKEGQSVVMVTHDARAALRADRILYILDGRIQGTLELPPYAADAGRDREAQLNSWLQSMAW